MGTFTGQFVTFNTLECASCDIPFAITDSFEKHRREDHENFYCPRGHGNVYYGKNEEEKLREQLTRTKNELEFAETCANRARERTQAARKQTAAYKGHLTRVKNRISEGVCPCCNRQFPNVQSHMKIKHPDYAVGQSL